MATLLIVLFPSLVASQDTGIYGPSGSPTTSFVRVINASTSDSLSGVRVGSTRFDPMELFSPYRPIRSGVYIVSVGDRTAELVARSGVFWTICVTDDAIQIHEDPRHDDPARAQIIVYAGAATSAVSLVTADGAVEVVPDVEPGQATEVAVNAVTATLAIVTDDVILEILDPISFVRGQSYGYVALPGERGFRVGWARAEVAAE